MPAVSKAQQKLFGIVHAIQTGRANPKKFSKSARRLAKTMSHADVKKYATTHVENLPKKIEELLKHDINSGKEHMTEYDGYIPITTDLGAEPAGQPKVSNDPNMITFGEDTDAKMNTILSIVRTKLPIKINNTLIDVYTATLLKKAIEGLSDDNKKKFLLNPIDKMVALAYRMVTK